MFVKVVRYTQGLAETDPTNHFSSSHEVSMADYKAPCAICASFSMKFSRLQTVG